MPRYSRVEIVYAMQLQFYHRSLILHSNGITYNVLHVYFLGLHKTSSRLLQLFGQENKLFPK